MCTTSYLQKKYKDYKDGIPVECLQIETLADKEEYKTLRKTVTSITGSRPGNFIPLAIFIFIVDDFLKYTS